MRTVFAIILAVVSGFAYAQSGFAPPAERSLVIATDGQVWKNGFGECWHSGFGPAPVSTAECDPNYKPYVAPAPAPRPTIVRPTPKPVVIERVTFDADALFDFDKAVLRLEGRVVLATFADKLKSVRYATIVVIGHTDRIGSDSYNQVLSEKRAAAVKAYLVSQGIDAGSVQTSGKGESQPVTKAGECKGANVIACLQPDRRVEVEVSGTRTK